MSKTKEIKIDTKARYRVRVTKPYPVGGTSVHIKPAHPSVVSGEVAEAMQAAGVIGEIEKV